MNARDPSNHEPYIEAFQKAAAGDSAEREKALALSAAYTDGFDRGLAHGLTDKAYWERAKNHLMVAAVVSSTLVLILTQTAL